MPRESGVRDIGCLGRPGKLRFLVSPIETGNLWHCQRSELAPYFQLSSRNGELKIDCLHESFAASWVQVCTTGSARTFQGKEGSLQPWIEKAVMEKDVVAKKIEIPDRWLKAMQQQVMFVFDNLIYNVDRNQGNILFLEDWKMVLIDHTRSFRLHKSLLNPDSIKFCERRLYEGLKSLDRQSLDERLGPYLTPGQIEAILARRDLLVRHFDNLIESKGEKAVLFQFFRVESK